jgi:hypothetical protein
MFVQFTIHYHVAHAQGHVNVHVQRDGEPTAHAYALAWSAGDVWSVRVPLAQLLQPQATDRTRVQLAYWYTVNDVHEFAHHRRRLALELELGASTLLPVLLRDVWRPTNRPANALLTSAFTRCVFHRDAPATPLAPLRLAVRGDALTRHVGVRFGLLASDVPSTCTVGVVGSVGALGAWHAPVLLNDAHFPLWQADVELGATEAFEYKYVLVETATKRVVEWEWGANRSFALEHVPREPGVSLQLVLHDESLRLAASAWRGGGVAVPVFSLRQSTEGGKGVSTGECGVGDFGSLVALVEWAASTGLRMVQVLPINDTITTYTYRDSYPYAAVSVNALHPLYLHLTQLGELSDPAAKAAHETERRRLNALPEVDYDGVIKAKLAYARAIYTRWKATRKAAAAAAAPAAAPRRPRPARSTRSSPSRARGCGRTPCSRRCATSTARPTRASGTACRRIRARPRSSASGRATRRSSTRSCSGTSTSSCWRRRRARASCAWCSRATFRSASSATRSTRGSRRSSTT